MSRSSSHPPRRRTTARDRFLALVQECAEIFWPLSPNGEMLDISRSWCRFTGQEQRQSLQRGWWNAVPPEDQAQIGVLLHQAVSTGNSAEGVAHLRRADGTFHLVLLRAIPARSPDGSIGEVLMCGKRLVKPEAAPCVNEGQQLIATQASESDLGNIICAPKQVRYFSRQAALLGETSDALASQECFLTTPHSGNQERIGKYMEVLRDQETVSETESRTSLPNGNIPGSPTRGHLPSDLPGHPPAAHGDMTRLMELEEQLQVANAHIRTILESISDAFMSLDAQWRYVSVNQRLSEMVGKDPNEFSGRTLWDVPELCGTLFEHHYRRAMEMQQIIHFEGYYPTLRRWLAGHLYPTRMGLSVSFQDITERKCAEEDLRESEARFRALVESNLIGITIADQEGSIHEANDAFLSLIGYTREDLAAGQVKWTALTPPEYQGCDTQALRELRTTGVARPFEKAYMTKDGKLVPVLIGGTLVRQEGSPPLILAFIVDLTANKELDRQKDLMLSMISHELKTPLCALKGMLQVLQRRAHRLCTTTPLVPEVSTFFDTLSERLSACVRQVDVQTQVINDLLDVSRVTTQTLYLELARHDLVDVVRETVEDLQAAAPERSLQLFLPENIMIPVMADRARLRQVITNYVTNAIRYSSPPHPVAVGLNLQGEQVRVWVRDQGPGLSLEAQQQVWQRFSQITGVPAQGGLGKGLGLGLSLCQTLVARHQGEVGVESTLGEGSTFWFTLPVWRSVG